MNDGGPPRTKSHDKRDKEIAQLREELQLCQERADGNEGHINELYNSFSADIYTRR